MPCGHFTLEKHGNSPLVLVAAGVGVTPIMSILDYYGEKYKKGEKLDQCIFRGIGKAWIDSVISTYVPTI